MRVSNTAERRRTHWAAAWPGIGVPRWSAAIGAAALITVASCGGGGDSGGSNLLAGYGPANPSACPKAALDDVWLDKRLPCLAADQKFIRNSAGATGAFADRAYIFGQQVLDGSLINVLGANKLRYFKHAVCVKGAPENVAPITLAVDLEVAVGINLLANGKGFYPPGVAGSTFQYGGLADANTLQIACSPATHPIIVSYASGRIESVNAAALAATQVFDR
ncbi:MAG: hypothetical protein KIT17_05555 [Rubrivivax sp.]|nr:hypothetical protein [Rubrivivax sp.]